VENSRRQRPQLDYAETPKEGAERADAVLVLTEPRRDSLAVPYRTPGRTS
jgi:UDPglucose 6-dehydrogenase